MDCGDGTVLDPQVFVDHLYDRCEAVCRARRRGDKVLRSVVQVMVHAIDDVQRPTVFYGCADHHFCYSGRIIGGDFCGGFEDTCTVNHQINAQFLEGQGFDGFLMSQADALAVQVQCAIGSGHRRAPAAMNRVELYQECVLLGITDRVVEQNDVTPRASVNKIAQDEFANPTEAVNSDTRHGSVFR